MEESCIHAFLVQIYRGGMLSAFGVRTQLGKCPVMKVRPPVPSDSVPVKPLKVKADLQLPPRKPAPKTGPRSCQWAWISLWLFSHERDSGIHLPTSADIKSSYLSLPPLSPHYCCCPSPYRALGPERDKHWTWF